MLFNSISFAFFLPLVFFLYWVIGRKNHKIQNIFLIIASYVFYGWWDWRFLSLLFISSLVDYTVGYYLGTVDKTNIRKILLTISLVVNLGLLGVFKYFNFFAESFAAMLNQFGMQANMATLNVILPVGISFYTFQTLSYSLDIYFGKLKHTKDPITVFAFVSFFPQLVAGPIERARALIPQFETEREFDLAKAKDGMRQMLWGFFKKIAIADNMAVHVNDIFGNYQNVDGLTLFLGVFFFTIQIYCDFSGYSDIAIGTARLFGFKLMRNFAYPYISRDIGEFWRRWHISLSSWFRDYVYIPLGGNRCGKWMHLRNTLITFTVSGFWHGANWTFIIWGFLNGLYYVPLMLMKKQKQNTDTVAEGRLFPNFKESGAMLITFLMAMFGWLFFRSESIGQAFEIMGRSLRYPIIAADHAQYIRPVLIGILPLIIEWFRRTKQHGLAVEELALPLRWVIYFGITILILVLGNFGGTEFIYFQF